MGGEDSELYVVVARDVTVKKRKRVPIVGEQQRLELVKMLKPVTDAYLGDANGDGNADIKDILLVNKHRLGKASLNNEYLKAGDVNKDEKVDIRDILQINKYRLNKINSL